MTTNPDARDWRQARVPKWVVDAAEAEMQQWKLTSALSWPTEPKPEPVPFMWGEYDRLTGTPIPGAYWTGTRSVERIEIRARTPEDGDEGWKPWRFRRGDRWTSSVVRGALYASERDAWLSVLWKECEEAAGRLMLIRNHL